MNNITIDLHGLTEEEAIPRILTGIISLELGEITELEIVTGRGEVLTRVVEEILEENHLSWTHKNNNFGSYYISLY